MLCVAALLILGDNASAATPIAPYDGSNPFRCELQQTGTGVAYPDPDADPFCVEYDKTQQNLTDFGLVDFLTKEPTRVAAAVPKCFYFQMDHWTGSVVQGQSPELWHWDGMYFFDKARGLGGVHVENFRVGGLPADPRLVPGFPAEFAPYFGSGGGGVYVTLGPLDPACAARVDTHAEQVKVYSRPWR